jgi:hypothetical protein
VRKSDETDGATLFLLESTKIKRAIAKGTIIEQADVWQFARTREPQIDDSTLPSVGFLGSMPDVKVVGTKWLTVDSKKGFGLFAFNTKGNHKFPAHSQAFLFTPDPIVEGYVELHERDQRLLEKKEKMKSHIRVLEGKHDRESSYDLVHKHLNLKRSELGDDIRAARAELKQLEDEHILLQMKLDEFRRKLEKHIQDTGNAMGDANAAKSILSEFKSGTADRAISVSWFACADIF